MSTFVSSSQWRALRTVTPWLIVTLVAMVRGNGTHVSQPPETWKGRGTHDKKAPQRKQNLLRPRKTKTIQKKGIWLFVRHLTLTFYLSKVLKAIFPQVIFEVKFPAFFKSAVKSRSSHLRKGSYLCLTLKIDLKVKIDGTVKCTPRSWSTFARTIFS